MINVQMTETCWTNSNSNSTSSDSVDTPEMLSVPTELLQSLKQHSLFQHTNNEKFIEKLSCCMHLRSYTARDVIIAEGESAKAMFFLLKGSVNVCSADFERIYATLEKGSCFGEIGILYSVPRTATVIATTKCIVAALTSEEIKTILPQFPEVEKVLRFEAEERLAFLKKNSDSQSNEKSKSHTSTDIISSLTKSVPEVIRENSLFKDCPEEFLQTISLKTEARNYAENEFILKKEDEGKEIFIISKGTAEDKDVDAAFCPSVKLYSRSDFFGEISTISNTYQKQNIRAVTAMEVYVLKKQDILSALSKFPALQDRFNLMSEVSLTSLQLKKHSINENATESVENSAIQKEPKSISKSELNSNISLSPSINTVDETSAAPTTKAQTLKSKETRRRRASVAIWSDPNLVALANKHMIASKDESKLKNQTDFVQLESNGYSGSGLLSRLSEDIMIKIVNHLDFKSVIILASVSKKLNEFTKQCSSILERIDLSYLNKKITNEAVKQITKFTGDRVKHISLSHCYYITDDGFKELISGIPKIESIDLNSCWLLTDKSLGILAELCPLVTSLDLSNCRKITNSGIFRLLNEKDIHKFPQVKELSLSYCKNLTDLTMGYLSEFCSGTLEYLNIQRCTRITDQGFVKWADKGFYHLTSLNLTDCSFLTDLAISHIVATAPNIKCIYLSFCCALSENSIQSLTSLPKLQDLDVSFCGAAVSNTSMEGFFKSDLAKSVSSLNVRGCVRITDEFIKVILKLNNLTSLNVSQCPGISSDAKKTVQELEKFKNLIV